MKTRLHPVACCRVCICFFWFVFWSPIYYFLFFAVIWHLMSVNPRRSQPSGVREWDLLFDSVGGPCCSETTASCSLWLIRGSGAFCFLFFLGALCTLVRVDLDFGTRCAGLRTCFKLWVLCAAVLERRMVVGAGWSPWRHPDPSSCLSAHSDKWLHTGQMGLLSPTHSSLDARGTGQHSPPPITPPSASI